MHRVMKIIYKKFDKQLISLLPRVLFPGQIIVVDDPQQVDEAVDFLLKQEILGVDTETRPSFQKGVRYEVSLLQVSTDDVCYLFRLNHVGMAPGILRLLTDTTVPKIGLSWHDDLAMLYRRQDFVPGLFIDIQDVSKKFGIVDTSLQKLFANIFHLKISKGQRLSNWEASQLKEGQQLYAATDAWACILLYRAFQEMNESGDYELVEPIAEPTHEESQQTDVVVSIDRKESVDNNQEAL